MVSEGFPEYGGEFSKALQLIEEIEEDEPLLSFGAKAFFPSSRIKEPTVLVGDWLFQHKSEGVSIITS